MNIREMRLKLSKGFTLLELLIVMVILGSLAGIVMVNYPASQKRSRDVRRRSDIKQYQIAMETYANKNGSFPATAATNISGSYCSTTLALSVCPNDPNASQASQEWNYRVYATSSDYRIWSRIELPAKPVTYFYVCASGESGETTINPEITNPC